MTHDPTSANDAPLCNCDVEPYARICPCETHEADEFTAWLEATAPRVAAARIAKDPLADLYPLPARAADAPELAELRAALSEPARALLDETWELSVGSESWPSANELALTARDAWQETIPAWERDALREHLRDAANGGSYPVEDPCETGSGVDPCTADQLLAEADALAEIARRVRSMERMLRDHAANQSTTAVDYLP